MVQTARVNEVLCDVAEGIATLTINRPDRLNAQNTATFEAALGHLERIAEDRTVRVVVLTGAGRAFSAGGDLVDIGSSGSGERVPRLERIRAVRMLTRTSELLHGMPQVTIAAVNGACAGGGMSWAMACDLRYAARSAIFTTAFVNAGLSGDFGMTWLLPRAVGPARAKELLFFADRFDAARAAELGVVHDVFDDDGFLAAVRAQALRLAGKAPLALAGLKANVNDAAALDFAAHLDVETARIVGTLGSADCAEAAHAFLEKRAPQFRGE